MLSATAWTNRAEAELADGRPADSAASCTQALACSLPAAADSAAAAGAAVAALVGRAVAAEWLGGEAAEAGLSDLASASALLAGNAGGGGGGGGGGGAAIEVSSAAAAVWSIEMGPSLDLSLSCQCLSLTFHCL